MNNKTRKVISLLLVAVIILCFTACGATAPKSDPSGYADQSAFLKDMAKGIQTRLANVDDAKHANDTDEQKAEYLSSLVKYELNQIGKYNDAIFEDSKFDILAHHYIHACEMQATATENLRNTTLANALWDGGGTARRGIIVTMYEQYELPIDSATVDNYRTQSSNISSSTQQTGITSAPENPALLVTDGKYLPGKSSEGYAYYSFTVKNNSDQTITQISLDTIFLNEEGNIVATGSAHLFDTRVAPNQSVTIETLINREELGGPATARVEFYTYCVNNENTSFKEYVDDSVEILIP